MEHTFSPCLFLYKVKMTNERVTFVYDHSVLKAYFCVIRSFHGDDSQVGEVGELSEIFQWRGEVPKGLPDWKEEDKVHLGEELSDVLLYLVRLSDICGVDLGKAALRKVGLNAIKYPVGSKGSSKET